MCTGPDDVAKCSRKSAYSRIESQIVGKLQGVEGFRVPPGMAPQSHGAKGVQSKAAMEIIHHRKLALVTAKGLPLQVDGFVNSDQTIRKERGPDLIPSAFKAQRTAPSGS